MVKGARKSGRRKRNGNKRDSGSYGRGVSRRLNYAYELIDKGGSESIRGLYGLKTLVSEGEIGPGHKGVIRRLERNLDSILNSCPPPQALRLLRALDFFKEGVVGSLSPSFELFDEYVKDNMDPYGDRYSGLSGILDLSAVAPIFLDEMVEGIFRGVDIFGVSIAVCPTNQNVRDEMGISSKLVELGRGSVTEMQKEILGLMRYFKSDKSSQYGSKVLYLEVCYYGKEFDPTSDVDHEKLKHVYILGSNRQLFVALITRPPWENTGAGNKLIVNKYVQRNKATQDRYPGVDIDFANNYLTNLPFIRENVPNLRGGYESDRKLRKLVVSGKQI